MKSVMNLKELVAMAKETHKSDMTHDEMLFWLRTITGISYAHLLLHEFSSKEIHQFLSIIKKRKQAVPHQKILKKTDFLSVDIYFSPHALSPRKETEILAELVILYINKINDKCSAKVDVEIDTAQKENIIKIPQRTNANKSETTKQKSSKTDEILDSVVEEYLSVGTEIENKNKAHSNSCVRVLDMCTGSGVIGLAIKKHTNAEVFLCDKSKKALKNCRKNMKKNKLQTHVFASDMFSKVKGQFDVIVSNPPYIKTAQLKNLSPVVKKYDPMMALDGGVDGMTFYKEIIEKAPQFLKEDGVLFLEIDEGLQKKIKKLLEKDFKYAKILKDFSGKHRFVCAKK